MDCNLNERAAKLGGVDVAEVDFGTPLNLNHDPTNISLSASAIAENNEIGATIGELTTTDQDLSDTFTYTLISGDGSTDNDSFVIEGSNLKAGISFDFETKSSYSVRVRSTDQGGKYFEKAFEITVIDVLEIPTNFISAFTVDTILGQLNWTDTNAGAAQYEVYSATNGAAEVLLGTTIAGAISYQDLTCKQNASVVYRIRAKKGSEITDFVAATALKTPLCWKTNQSTLTPVVFGQLNIAPGKSVTAHWGDGTSQAYSGNNATITKNYSIPGQYNIWLTGDTNSITYFAIPLQYKNYGNIGNWILPSALTYFSFTSSNVSGDISGWVLPATLTDFYINSTAVSGDISGWILPPVLNFLYVHTTNVSGDISGWVIPSTATYIYCQATYLTGSLPQISASTNSLKYQVFGCRMSDSNTTVFRKAMTAFNVGSQNVIFPTANIDKLLKAAADWYQTNAPTANCTFTLSGANMGIPTGGASNADLVRLVGYYTTASKTATVLIRTS